MEEQAFSVSSMIDKYSVTDETFVVTLPHGETLKFKLNADFERTARICKEAQSWSKKLLAGELPAFKEYPTHDEDIAFGCYLISALSCEENRISQLDALRIKANCGSLFAILQNEVVSKVLDIQAVRELNAMEQAGNDLTQTS